MDLRIRAFKNVARSWFCLFVNMVVVFSSHHSYSMRWAMKPSACMCRFFAFKRFTWASVVLHSTVGGDAYAVDYNAAQNPGQAQQPTALRLPLLASFASLL